MPRFYYRSSVLVAAFTVVLIIMVAHVVMPLLTGAESPVFVNLAMATMGVVFPLTLLFTRVKNKRTGLPYLGLSILAMYSGAACFITVALLLPGNSFFFQIPLLLVFDGLFALFLGAESSRFSERPSVGLPRAWVFYTSVLSLASGTGYLFLLDPSTHTRWWAIPLFGLALLLLFGWQLDRRVALSESQAIVA